MQFVVILYGRTQFAPTNEFKFSARWHTFKQDFIFPLPFKIPPRSRLQDRFGKILYVRKIRIRLSTRLHS